MLTLNNVTTQDTYEEELTLGPVSTAEKIVYLVANKSVFAQVAGQSKAQTSQPWSDEILITPQSGEFQRVQGIRFRSAVAGAPAQVIAQLITPDDPVPVGGTAYAATLSSSGGVTPGATSVQIQNNEVLVGTEPILDFDFPTNGVSWTGTDDVANTRVIVSPLLRMGAGVLTWPGGTRQATDLVVAHTMGTTPRGVVATASAEGVNYVFCMVFGIGAVNFSIRGLVEGVSGIIPVVGTTTPFYWFAF